MLVAVDGNIGVLVGAGGEVAMAVGGFVGVWDGVLVGVEVGPSGGPRLLMMPALNCKIRVASRGLVTPSPFVSPF